jgi:hypothetical protein
MALTAPRVSDSDFVVTRVPARFRRTPTGKHNDGEGPVSWLPGPCCRPPSQGFTAQVAHGRPLAGHSCGGSRGVYRVPETHRMDATLCGAAAARQSGFSVTRARARLRDKSSKSAIRMPRRRPSNCRRLGNVPQRSVSQMSMARSLSRGWAQGPSSPCKKKAAGRMEKPAAPQTPKVTSTAKGPSRSSL